jgi:hypothetical protein
MDVRTRKCSALRAAKKGRNRRGSKRSRKTESQSEPGGIQ